MISLSILWYRICSAILQLLLVCFCFCSGAYALINTFSTVQREAYAVLDVCALSVGVSRRPLPLQTWKHSPATYFLWFTVRCWTVSDEVNQLALFTRLDAWRRRNISSICQWLGKNLWCFEGDLWKQQQTQKVDVRRFPQCETQAKPEPTSKYRCWWFKRFLTGFVSKGLLVMKWK